MNDVFIYDHVRTPRGKGRADGGLYTITPVQMAAEVLRALRDRNNLDTRLVDEIILGTANIVGEQASVPAKSAAYLAGYPDQIAGLQVSRFCASGLDAINIAAAQIACGQATAMIAGGVESMSRVPPGGSAWPNDPEIAQITKAVPVGIAADLLASLNGFSRTDVDQYALESQQRAANAWNKGYFTHSVIPVRDNIGEVRIARDEHFRADTTLEGLSKLKLSFDVMGEQAGFDALCLLGYPELERVRHVHTAGNSSGVVDGASGVLIGSRAFGKISGLKPRARIKGFTSVGSEPLVMMTGPVPATHKLLKRCGLEARDVDLYELNEAFASVVLHYMKAMDIPRDRINVNGGAIALGHPLGATGGMILGTVLDELERRDLSTAVVTLCAAIGLSTATLIERV